jgi:hypothetical protein
MSWIVNFYGTVGDVMSFGVSSTNLQTRPFDSLASLPLHPLFLSCTEVGDKIYLQYNIVTLRSLDMSVDPVTRWGCNCEASCWSFLFLSHCALYRSALSLLHNILTCVTLSLTNKLTTWSRVVFQKVTVPQLVKKFPPFNVTLRVITAFTRAHYRGKPISNLFI